MVLYICLEAEKMWENVRNKKKMCFIYYFQQHNQTLENIFQNIFWNATKHLKIFSFPENSIFKKYLFSGKYFTWTKHNLSFSATNNEAECESLLKRMTMVLKMGGRMVEVFSDLWLVVGQVKGKLEARD